METERYRISIAIIVVIVYWFHIIFILSANIDIWINFVQAIEIIIDINDMKTDWNKLIITQYFHWSPFI